MFLEIIENGSILSVNDFSHFIQYQSNSNSSEWQIGGKGAFDSDYLHIILNQGLEHTFSVVSFDLSTSPPSYSNHVSFHSKSNNGNQSPQPTIANQIFIDNNPIYSGYHYCVTGFVPNYHNSNQTLNYSNGMMLPFTSRFSDNRDLLIGSVQIPENPQPLVDWPDGNDEFFSFLSNNNWKSGQLSLYPFYLPTTNDYKKFKYYPITGLSYDSIGFTSLNREVQIGNKDFGDKCVFSDFDLDTILSTALPFFDLQISNNLSEFTSHTLSNLIYSIPISHSICDYHQAFHEDTNSLTAIKSTDYSGNNLKAFPNPLSGNSTLTISLNDLEEINYIHLYSMGGAFVDNLVFSKRGLKEVVVQLHDVPSGAYYVILCPINDICLYFKIFVI
jgi:hypothetical protein